MKKYLMTGVAALAICAAFTSCSKSEELYDPEAAKGISTEQEIANVYNSYNQAFIKTFGQVDPNVDWGFGKRANTRANTGENYPTTHEYKDANGNVVAGANMNHNEWADANKEKGGWVVPPALTPDQKAVVTAYFQATPNIGYNDPGLRHFFVQQVYKGVTGTHEGITDANNTTYNSDAMNLLTVGQANSHINDFNAGTCTESDVLDNGQSVGGSSHKDQITLMVNVDDTSCFGYHETASSTHHNNKAGLVSWSTIDTWAQTNYPGYDGCLDDTWNRSFMGFDLALKEGAQAYATDDAGNVLYADYSQAPTSPIYGWDGEKIVEMGTSHKEQPDPNNQYWIVDVFDGYKDEYKNIMKGTEAIGWLTTNKNFYIAADQITLTGEYSNGEIPQSALNNEALKNVLVFKDVQVPGAQNNKAHVINLKRIKELVDAGYLPVKDKSLTEWVKVGKSDGYFSDWIVTLTEAQRQIPSSNKVRIMAEDLNAQAVDGDIEKSDWDFNDVVFDVEFDKTGNGGTITLICAGGVLPLKVAGVEVHTKFDPSLTQDEKGWYPMINTGKGMGIDRPQVSFHIDNADPDNNGKGIVIEVEKTLSNGTKQWLDLRAQKGQPSSKFAVKPTVQPCLERDHIDFVSDHAFSRYVGGAVNELIW